MRSFMTLAALCGAAVAASNYTVDPDDFETSDKATWCNSQFNTCTTLCNAGGGGTTIDECDSATLEYSCICANGSAPGLEYYTNSMDTILCQQEFQLCIEDTVGDSAGQSACATDIQDNCGTLDPNDAEAAEVEEDTTSDSDSDSASETTSTSESTETSDSGAVPANIHHYGNAAGAVAIGLLAYML